MLNATERAFGGTHRFEIRNRIGAGAVGVVYEAFDREHGTPVALKTLRRMSADNLLSLKREFRAVQDIRHPNLVRLGELLEADGTWFFTMELLRGLPFTRWIRSGESPTRRSRVPRAPSGVAEKTRRIFDEEKVRACLVQLLEGLAALHAAGKVHRDIKPSNVLVTPEGRVVILDFGVASDAVPDAGQDESMVGTAPYMAPEQVLLEAIGPAADFYAVGVMLYHALTSKLPFEGTFQQIVEQKLTRTPAPPRELVPDAPEDLAELCMALLETEPHKRPSHRDIAARLGIAHGEAAFAPQQPASLVGRRQESQTLESAFEQTRGGQGASVLIAGESGVGKSFLVHRFLERVKADHPEVLVLSGRCYERESVPYKAFDGIIDQLSQLLASMPEDDARALLPATAGLLMRAFPVLQAVAALVQQVSHGLDVLNPQELRARVFSGLRELFFRLARSRPVVVAIDDLQWADADSLQLLEELMRTPDEPQLLLLATLRLGTDARRVGAPVGPIIPGAVHHVSLETLSFEDACALAVELLARAGEECPSPDQVRRIVEDAKGHPLFIDELVRQRSIGHTGQVIRLDDALWRRVERLEPAMRRLLEVLAVAGSPLSHELVAETAALDIGQVFEIATHLRVAALVRMNGTQRTSELEPYHDRIRESVLAHLEPTVRAQWHKRLATTLEQRSEIDPETIATHWQGAGQKQRAAEYFVRAAEQAATTLAFERAARLFATAIDSGVFPAGPELRELKRQLAESLGNAGQLAAAADVRLALVEGAEPEEQLELRRQAAEQLMCSGNHERGLALLRATLRSAGIYNPRSRLALLCAVIFMRLLIVVRGLSLRVRERVPAREFMRADACWSAGQAYGMSDNIRGAYFQARALVTSLDTGDPQRVVRSLGMTICTHSAMGVPAEAQSARMVRKEHAIAQSLGTAEALAFAAGAGGFAHFNVGRWREARVELTQAEALFRDQCVGNAYELNSIRYLLYRTLYNLGELRELGERVGPVLRRAQHLSDRYMIIICQSAGTAFVAAAADRPDEADAAVRDARERLVQGALHLQHYWTYTAEAQVALYRGDDLAAFERLDWLWRGLKGALLHRVVSCRMVTISLRGRAAASALLARKGRDSELRRVAEADAGAMEREPMAWGKPAAQTIRATLALARGDHERALLELAGAQLGYESAHMGLCAAGALRQLGVLRQGDEGAALVAEADRRFAAQGVLNPARMSAMLVGHVQP